MQACLSLVLSICPGCPWVMDRHHISLCGASLCSPDPLTLWGRCGVHICVIVEHTIGFQGIEGRGWSEESCPDTNLPNPWDSSCNYQFYFVPQSPEQQSVVRKDGEKQEI